LKPANKTSNNRHGPPDVLKHLADSLESGWRRYCKRLKRCQKSFSEEAVHDSRVETRRLISTIELLGAFIPEQRIKKARRALKDHLDTFDQLRDTQVQLDYVQRMEHTFRAAKSFRNWLRKREKRFTRQTRKSVKKIKTKRAGRCIAGFQKGICRLQKHRTRAAAFDTVLNAMQRAFSRVAQQCRRVRAADTTTIHRTRVAFKRFRYMVEALSPIMPAVTEEHRRAMHGYQSMMGDIQDVEVLIAALNKFLGKHKVNAKSVQRLLDELLRRRQWLIRVYLNAAGKLQQFWPTPGLLVAKPMTGRERKTT
jgi:CHAD domain-containing protein